jgi:carbohydrate-selective porin OprB
VYDGDTFDGDPVDDSVLDFAVGGDDGWFIIGEVAYWKPAESWPGGGAHLRLGGWLHTASFQDTERESGRGGAYLAVDFPLWSEGEEDRKAGRSVSCFGRLEWAPGEFSWAEWSGDGGLLFEGLLPSRFDDALGVGVAWTRLSDRARSAEAEVLAGEAAIEVTWSVALTPWCEIQPDYQWILNLGDSIERGAAHVIGIRTHLTF